MLPTLLTLAPEFGGTVFGPFPAGSVVLGSDPQRCSIVLSPAAGAWPVHATITPDRGGGFVLQPTSADTLVFQFLGSTPRQVHGHATLAAGVWFAIGSPQGPRFAASTQAPHPRADQASHGGQAGRRPPGAAQHRGGRRPPTAADMAAELKRQAGVAMMTSGPAAQASHTAFRALSGALFHPRVIVGALIALGGLMFTGCGGLATFLMHQ